MDIRSYVNNHAKLSHLKEGGNRGEYRGECPFHGGGYSNFAVNVNTGFFICRAGSCGVRGGFPLLYKMLEGITSWEEVRKRLDRTLPIKNWKEVLDFQTSVGPRRPDVQYDELPLDAFQQVITKENFLPYLQTQRKYDSSICDLGFDLRFCFGGEYRNRILLPFYDLDRRLCTFTARSIIPSEEVRYRFPEGATTNQFLFGIHRLPNSVKRMFIVEGQFDVIRLATYGEFAIGLSTVTASSRQLLDIQKIAKLYQCQVYVMLDSGAFHNSQLIWAALKALGVNNCKPIDLSDYAKDPDTLSFEDLTTLLKDE